MGFLLASLSASGALKRNTSGFSETVAGMNWLWIGLAFDFPSNNLKRVCKAQVG